MVRKYKFPRRFLPLDQEISYRSFELLVSFLTSQGKIVPRSVSRVTLKQQRKISKAIKTARSLKVLVVPV
ncbi:ribosomal protein S18 (plastid) [Cryptomonas paramecium]|uniref:Ribosomal protein S18 n=1 Tax=Cryptomonas paramaecium TaxID=2898 RepID=D2IS83_9CRYP|nr:ribosomal protein S18 [Cryptomonas paramecium]ACT46775.1 ribosomal protein S18 [Cryptomonas paramecium]BDA98020.1 ribosomal protein S18 [Cryptomonas paramecium]